LGIGDWGLGVWGCGGWGGGGGAQKNKQQARTKPQKKK